MLTISSLVYRIAGRTLFDGASAQVPDGHRVGLVGRNGAGKSTLLGLILGELHTDGGSIELNRGARIGNRRPGGAERPADAGRSRARRRYRTPRPAGRSRDGAGCRPHWRDPCPARRYRRPFGTVTGGPDPGRPRLRRRDACSSRCRASPAAGACASPWPPCCSPSPICCCSTNRPTISTSKRRSGSKPI
ncbi:MAG: ATP-binding cassette domain-containing protein [Aliidongia sp.]